MEWSIRFRKISNNHKKRKKPKLRIEIDNQYLLKNAEQEKTIYSLISSATSEIKELDHSGRNESNEDHFTEIRLENILSLQASVFDKKEIEKYLQKTVPAPFDLEKFSRGEEINKILSEKGVIFPEVNINYNGKKIFRPPFENETYRNSILEYPFEINGKLVAYGWVLLNKENGQLNFPKGGVFFKRRGFSVGDEFLINEYFKGKKYYQWQYGEIHILSEDIIENASRNRFKLNTNDVADFLDEIDSFTSTLMRANRSLSTGILTKKVQKVEKAIEEGRLKDIKRDIEDLEKASNSINNFPDIKPYNEIEKEINQEISKQSEKISEVLATYKQAGERRIDLNKKTAEDFSQFCHDNLSPRAKSYFDRFKKKSRGEHQTTLMDSIIGYLKEKSEIKDIGDADFKDLCEKCFGFKIESGKINMNNKPVINYYHNNNKMYNRQFGIMVKTLYDIFVNQRKHNDSFDWYNEASPERKEFLDLEMQMTVDLICTLLDQATIDEEAKALLNTN